MHKIIIIIFFNQFYLSSRQRLSLRYIAISSREDLKLGMVSYRGNGVCRLSPRSSSYPDSFTRGDVRLWDMLLTRNVGTPLEPSIHPRVQLSTNPPSRSCCSHRSQSASMHCVISIYYRELSRKKTQADYERLAFTIFHKIMRNCLEDLRKRVIEMRGISDMYIHIYIYIITVR